MRRRRCWRAAIVAETNRDSGESVALGRLPAIDCASCSTTFSARCSRKPRRSWTTHTFVTTDRERIFRAVPQPRRDGRHRVVRTSRVRGARQSRNGGDDARPARPRRVGTALYRVRRAGESQGLFCAIVLGPDARRRYLRFSPRCGIAGGVRAERRAISMRRRAPSAIAATCASASASRSSARVGLRRSAKSRPTSSTRTSSSGSAFGASSFTIR